MDMVEKVAKAINDTMINYGDYKPIGLARTAIAAMREPTEEMIFDGGKAVLIVHHTLNTGDVYRAMIDAALEEKK
jgi:hypothetical protein